MFLLVDWKQNDPRKNRESLKRKQTTNETQLERGGGKEREGEEREGEESTQVFQFIREALRTITLTGLVPFELDLNWRCWWVEQLQILVVLDVGGQTDRLKVRPELGTPSPHWLHRVSVRD